MDLKMVLINIGVLIDRDSNKTTLVITYYNPSGEEVTTSCVYDDVFSGNNNESTVFGFMFVQVKMMIIIDLNQLHLHMVLLIMKYHQMVLKN